MERDISLKLLYDQLNRDGFCELSYGYKIEHSYQEKIRREYHV